MMSEIIKFQLKGIKMIRLKGLNKILRIGLLAGALLGIATPLMAKPLFTDTDLIDYLSKSKSNIKKEYAIDCNSQIDGSKYLNNGWNLSKNLPQEWKTAFLSCVNKKQLSKKEQELQKIVDERNEQIKKDEEWLVACRNYVRESRKKAESNFLKKIVVAKAKMVKYRVIAMLFIVPMETQNLNGGLIVAHTLKKNLKTNKIKLTMNAFQKLQVLL